MLQNKKRIISLILMLTLLVSSLVVGAISASAETTKYRLQAKVDGTTYYWDGSVSSGKGGMTTDVSNAVELTVEVVNSETNEVYITFDNNGTTMYLYFTNGNTGFKTQSSKATIHYDATTGYVYEADFTDARYASTYGTDSIRSYKTSNIDGESNVYMVMTAITSSEGGDVVDPEDPVISPVETGDYYIATKRSTGNNYWYMTNDLGEASTKRYQAVDSGLTALPQSIANAENDKIFVVEDNDDGTYSIYAKGTTGDNYLGWTSGNSGTLVAADSALKFTIDAKEDGYYNIHFTGDAERYLSLNNSTGSNYFAFYKGTQAQNLYLIPVVESSGCGDNHTWNEGVATTPATCVSEGVMTYTCTACGEKKTEVISVNAEAHTWDNGSVTTEATCSSEGSKLYTCTLNASHTKTETIAINSEAHNWDDGVVTTPATCVSEGVMTYTCSLNGEHTRTEVIAADHNYVGGYCTKCCNGQPKWVLVDDVSTLGANDKIVIVAGDDSNYALSTNQKSSNREAVVFTISEGVVSFGSDVEIITLEDAGDGMFYFKVSNGYLYASSASSNQLKTRENNDSNAAYGQWIVSMADDVVSIVANRTGRNTLQYNPNNGSPIFSCYGGSTLTAVGIYKLETPEAKHTYDGCLDAECNVCKTVREASHDFTAEIVSENTLATAATCTSAAKYYYSCSVCGAVDSAEDADTFENGDALGHAWNGGVVTTDPSCTAEGVKTYTCGTCGETYTESVHMTEHNWSEATCTTPSTCSGCGATDGDPLDHVWNDGVVTTEPSCTAEGVITYTCGTCGTTDTDSIEATGHNIVDGDCPNCEVEFTLEEKLSGTGTVEIPAAGVTVSGYLYIGGDVTVVLNGDIKADGVILYNDNARFEGNGKLIIPEGRISLVGESDHMAIWDGTGYIFREVKDQAIGSDTGEDSFNIVFRPSFGTIEENKTLLGSEIDEGLTFTIQIFNGASKVYEGMVGEDVVREAYANNKAISLSVKGADAGATYTVKLVITSKIGLTNTADLITVVMPAPADEENN